MQFTSLVIFKHIVMGLTENPRHEIVGHELARHDKYLMKIDYITLECVNVQKNLTAPAHHKYSSVL